MRESEFENYLLADKNIKSKDKAVRSRMAKARQIERHFDTSLDSIVADDVEMYQTLKRIKAELKDINGTVSNALRKYYVFTNEKSFPALSDYENRKG
jgi:hypothetical protein